MANSQVQIQIFDTTLTPVAIIDDYEDCSFGRDFFESSPFTVTINRNINNAASFVENYFVLFGTDMRNIYIITKIVNRVSEDGAGSEYMDISGFDCKSLFMRRIIANYNNGLTFYSTGPAETVIKTLINYQCGPSCADANRIFSLLQIATDQARGSTFTLRAKKTSVYQEAMTCATQSLLGWYVYADLVNKKLILDCEVGTNRATSALFSQDNGSLVSANANTDLNTFRNLVYVGGSGTSAVNNLTPRYVSTPPTDLNRYEMFIDAMDLPTVAGVNQRGDSTLTQYNQKYEIDGEILPTCPYVYKSDFYVGDTVTVSYNGDSYQVIVLNITEAYKSGDYSMIATWGKPQTTAAAQIAQLSNLASGNITKIDNQFYPEQTVSDYLGTVITIPAGLNLPVRGSNANGQYELWPDGTLHQFFTGAGLTTSTGTGTVYFTYSGYTFPIPFYSTNHARSTCSGISGNTWAGMYTTFTLTGIVIFILGSQSTNVGAPGFHVQGRWKA